MGTSLSLSLLKLSTANRHVMTVLHEVLHALLQREQTWTTLHQSDAVYRERTLQSRHLEELVQYDVSVSIPLHVHHDTHTLTARLIVDVRDTIQFALLHEVSDILYELSLVYTIGNLRHYYLVVALLTLYLSLRTHDDASAASLVGILYALNTIYICTRREVRSLDILHQAVGVYLRIVYVSTATVDYLTQIVRRNVRRHTDGDTVTTIHQQVRDTSRHHRRLLQRVVEVVHHIHGILLQVIHDVLTHLREAALRVTHSSRRVAVH